MLLYPHCRFVARGRLEVRGRLEGLAGGQSLGARLERPVAGGVSDLVSAAVLVGDGSGADCLGPLAGQVGWRLATAIGIECRAMLTALIVFQVEFLGGIV